MVVHDVLRRRLDIRNCETCDESVAVNADDPERVDAHHVFAFSDGSGGHTATEYATYIFCSVGCMKEYCDAYFQRMLETDDGGDEEDDDRVTATAEG